MQGHQLQLAPHVQACHSDGQVILLDLRRDKYLGVGGAHMQVLAGAIGGWPRGSVVEDVPVSPADLGVLTKRLLLQGLLTDQPPTRARLPDATVPEAVASLGAEDAIEEARVGPRRLFWFMQSAAAAAVSLRCRSLLSVVHAVAKRRAWSTADPALLSLDAAREAVAAYEKLRPLVFTSRDKCLFDSLALVNFLAHDGLYPRWVIGVKTAPFGAHSWVQIGGTVLNDLHERVRKFTPILVV